eukprot:358252-Chlamydomonas_euryale.AAC.3
MLPATGIKPAIEVVASKCHRLKRPQKNQSALTKRLKRSWADFQKQGLHGGNVGCSTLCNLGVADVPHWRVRHHMASIQAAVCVLATSCRASDLFEGPGVSSVDNSCAVISSCMRSLRAAYRVARWLARFRLPCGPTPARTPAHAGCRFAVLVVI